MAQILFVSESAQNKPKCIPYPKTNINGGMTGYDPIMGNTMDSIEDPGIRSRIFLHDCEHGYWSFIGDIRDDLQCDADFSMKTISTMQQYESESEASTAFSLEASVSAEGSFFGISASASASFGLATDSEERASEKVLTKYDGEIQRATATCLTHSVTISDIVRPIFTPDFIAHLKDMDAASQSGNTQKEDDAVKAFIFEFGTHYAKTTNLGAQLIYERRYRSKSDSKETESSRSGCTKMEAGASVSVSGGLGGVEASASSSNDECKGNAEGSAFEKGESFEQTRTISRGSRPKSLADWIDADFTPVAIKRTLNLITDLFKDEWLTASEAYGIDESLSGASIKTMFEKVIKRYCGLMLTNILDDTCNIKGKILNNVIS